MRISWQSRKHECRYKKACKQYIEPIQDLQYIFECTVECLNNLGLDTSQIKTAEDIKKKPPYDDEFYNNVKDKFNLHDERDIVWMKFTKNKHHLGVVATSNDINFDIPKSKDDYLVQDKNEKWVYNFSGVIAHYLGEEWNTEYVLVFPLVNMKKTYTRHYVEKSIGNYLIDKGVPILDYYSHKLGGK